MTDRLAFRRMDEPERVLRTTCTNHCGNCGRHFSSLGAFDIHKEHDDAGWPHCLDPLDLQDRDGKPRLETKMGYGECDIYEHQADVTIWAIAGSHEKYLRWAAQRELGLAGPFK